MMLLYNFMQSAIQNKKKKKKKKKKKLKIKKKDRCHERKTEPPRWGVQSIEYFLYYKLLWNKKNLF